MTQTEHSMYLGGIKHLSLLKYLET